MNNAFYLVGFTSDDRLLANWPKTEMLEFRIPFNYRTVVNRLSVSYRTFNINSKTGVDPKSLTLVLYERLNFRLVDKVYNHSLIVNSF